MALCYLYPENEQDSHTQFQNEHSNEMPDGTGVKTHGTQRLCWPGVPFLLAPLPTWKQLTHTNNLDVASLSYNDTCHTDAVRAAMDMVDALGFGYTDRLAPVALMLRSGEAIDAIENFVSSGRNATPTEAGGFVLCGLMQLGGLLYWAVIIPLLAIVLLCLPICTACGVFCYNTLCCCVRMRALEAGAGGGEAPADAEAPVGLFPGGSRSNPFAHARLPKTTPPVSPPSPTCSDIQEKRRAKRANDTRLRSLLVQRHAPSSCGIAMGQRAQPERREEATAESASLLP